MSEDYEYEVEDLSKFYYWFSQIGGSAFNQKDTELLEALKAVALLLPSRLPPNMNMMDLTLIGMPPSVRGEFETMSKADNLRWTDFALKRRGSEEERTER